MTAESTWEDRMAARAAGRAARQEAEAEAAEVAERDRRTAEGLPEPVGYPGHEGHHWHVRYGANYQTCSCGGFVPSGCWTAGYVSLPEDPAEAAQAQREEDDYRAWVTCRYCCETGVTADDVLGVWPPRKVHDR